MKRIILIVFPLLLIANTSIGQTEDHTKLPPFIASSSRPDLVNFIGYNVNDILPYVEGFLQNKMQFSLLDNETKSSPGLFTIVCGPQISQGGAVNQRLKLHFKVDSRNIITAFYADGYWDYVIRLFVEYWPTKIGFEEAKSKTIAVEYWINEKITLKLVPGKTKGTLWVSKNS